jgi:hypothetical protein
MVNAVNAPQLRAHTPTTDAAKLLPGEGSSTLQGQHPRMRAMSGALSDLKTRGGEQLKAGVQAGTQRLRVGTNELKTLMAAKVSDKVAEQLTPEKIASVAWKTGKIIAKSAPALAAGPAGVPAFAEALMANGGAKIASDLKHKVQDELMDPKAQKRILLEGTKMVAQAFSKPTET